MLVLGIRYLTGCAVAATPADREVPEWPPHPARVFMALAAAYFEADGDEDEREALEWLEARPEPPALRVSRAEPRTTTTRYVPINDDPVGKKPGPLQSAPGLMRHRAERTFASVRPHDECVYLVWPVECPESLRSPLASLCGKVNRIGHSSSLVQVWVENNGATVEPTLVPHSGTPRYRLRTPTKGLLRALEEAYPDVRPSVSTWTPYGPPGRDAQPISASVFDPVMIALRLQAQESGPGRLGLEMTARLTQALRGAVLHHADEPILECLSGHRPDGSPSRRPHLAWSPLADVGHLHADGHLLGVAAVLPRDLSTSDHRACVRTVASIEVLLLGRLGKWRLTPEEREDPPYALRPETWTRPSRDWASVTPVVFDRFTEDPDEKRAVVAESCQRVGLPRPASVILTSVSLHLGVPHSAQFPPLPAPRESPQRPYTHAILAFEEPVSGPVIIGAGRYRGYGFFRPHG